MSEVPPRSWFRKTVHKIISLRPVSRVSARTLHHIDRLVFGLSAGRLTMTGYIGGLPIITLKTTGAKSGLQRSVPLIGIPDEEKILLIASNWGQEHFPGWYHNLVANPPVEVISGSNMGAYLAREAEGAEYDNYWKMAVSRYGGYAAYKERTGGRRIPLIILTPI